MKKRIVWFGQFLLILLYSMLKEIKIISYNGIMVNLYQEILMDHYRNPRNHRALERYDFIAQQRNSSCGDEVTVSGLISNNILTHIGFAGKGCVISQATASLLSEKISGMSCDKILALDNDDLIAMIGMPLGPVRLLCALLSLVAVQNGIREYSLSKK